MNKLISLRLEKKITQKKIAKELGIATSTYCQYETGERSIPLEKVLEICKILECTTNDIFLPTKFTVSK